MQCDFILIVRLIVGQTVAVGLLLNVCEILSRIEVEFENRHFRLQCILIVDL